MPAAQQEAGEAAPKGGAWGGDLDEQDARIQALEAQVPFRHPGSSPGPSAGLSAETSSTGSNTQVSVPLFELDGCATPHCQRQYDSLQPSLITLSHHSPVSSQPCLVTGLLVVLTVIPNLPLAPMQVASAMASNQARSAPGLGLVPRPGLGLGTARLTLVLTLGMDSFHGDRRRRGHRAGH